MYMSLNLAIRRIVHGRRFSSSKGIEDTCYRSPPIHYKQLITALLGDSCFSYIERPLLLAWQLLKIDASKIWLLLRYFQSFSPFLLLQIEHLLRKIISRITRPDRLKLIVNVAQRF
ncbi:hypothetical protein D3C78_1272760 [compost metagenome]